MKFSPLFYYYFTPDLDKNPPKCLYMHVNCIYCLSLNGAKAQALQDKAAFLFITGNKRGLWPRHPQPRSPPPPPSLMMMTLKSIQCSFCWTFSICLLSPFSLSPSLPLWLTSAPSRAAPRPTSDIFITESYISNFYHILINDKYTQDTLQMTFFPLCILTLTF